MNTSAVHIDLGINTAFMTRRYEEPASWMRIVKELGFDYLSFDSDALDPFFSGDREYVLEKARQIGALARREGLVITDYLTGYCSYRFMGLSHRDEQQRQRMTDWMRSAIDTAAAMGAGSIGGRFDALSVEVRENPAEADARMRETERLFLEIASYARQAGMTSIANEVMYVPSLYPHTFGETRRFFENTNPGRGDCVPVRPILDTGHMCGQNYGLTGDELRYESWLERWGAACEIIHIQQTRRESSDHAPFLENGSGDVHLEDILESLHKSILGAARQPWYPYLSVPDRIILVLEALPGTSTNEQKLLDDLGECGRYLRRFIPKGGLDIGRAPV